MRFTKDHQWVELQGEIAAVGLTAYAAGRLGDVVNVTLPAEAQALKAGAPMARIEGVNAVLNLMAPVDGEIVEADTALSDTPETISQDPEKDGWIVKLKVTGPDQVDALMDRPAYEAHLDTL